MFEIIFQMLGEALLQLVSEILSDLGVRAVQEPFQRPSNPPLAAIGYGLFGLIVGYLSLYVVEAHLLRDKPLQMLNLIVTPAAIGLAMAEIGAWRARRGDAVLPIDRFFYAYLFALAFAIVRFQFAK
jgi:hypothetical protein